MSILYIERAQILVAFEIIWYVIPTDSIRGEIEQMRVQYFLEILLCLQIITSLPEKTHDVYYYNHNSYKETDEYIFAFEYTACVKHEDEVMMLGYYCKHI